MQVGERASVSLRRRLGPAALAASMLPGMALAAERPAGHVPAPALVPAPEMVVAGMVRAPTAAWAMSLAAALAPAVPATRGPSARAPLPADVARRAGLIAGAAVLTYLDVARSGARERAGGDVREARAEAMAAQLARRWRLAQRRAAQFEARARMAREALGASEIDGLGLERVLARLALEREQVPPPEAVIEPADGARAAGDGEAVPVGFEVEPAAALSSPAREPLALPVDGALVERFGDPERGLRSRGVAFRVDASGPVQAPCGGRVVFAAPFRSFGLLLIIQHADGYHTLLSGMSRLDVRVGQVVRRGQPVGLMAVEGSGSSRLYMELRRSGEPIDPMPSLAARDEKVRG